MLCPKNKNFILCRIRNPQLLLAVASLIYLILTNVFKIQILESEYNNIVNGIVSILIFLGIINNPTTSSLFDDEDNTKDKKNDSQE